MYVGIPAIVDSVCPRLSTITEISPQKTAIGTSGAAKIFVIIPKGARFPNEKRVIGRVKIIAEILVEMTSERNPGICIFCKNCSRGFERTRSERVARKES